MSDPSPGERVPVPVGHTDAAPLTRREARMLEQRKAAPPRPTPRAVTAPTGPAARPTKHRHRRSRLAKRLLSVGALLLAGGIAFGMSVPANALLGPEALVPRTPETAAVPGAPRVQSLDVPDGIVRADPVRDQFGTLSYAEVLRLTYAEVDYTFAATLGSIRWPFPYMTTISDGWGDREGGFHKGVDFTPGGGAPIYAIADGVATVVDNGTGVYGTHVIITHNIDGRTVTSLYAHMQESSTPIVTGQEIKVGDFLGLVGDTGLSFGAHLHLEIHLDGTPVDPFAWLSDNVN